MRHVEGKRMKNDATTGATEPEVGQTGEQGVERLLAFSDGVFAIAITLLVLDLRVPVGARDLGHALLNAWPHYLSYALSFVTIGIVWANHHGLFRAVRRSDHTFLLINIVFLMWIAALPFPTTILADYLGKHGERTAMLVYTGSWVVGTIPFNLLWLYASAGNRLLGPGFDPAQVAVITRSYLLGPVFYIAIFLIAFVSVPVSLALGILIAIFYAVSPIPTVANLPFMRPLTGASRSVRSGD
jgi:uncharacterized membrane protein